MNTKTQATRRGQGSRRKPAPQAYVVVNNTPAQMFSPHQFKTVVKLDNGMPMVYLTREVFSRMWHYVDIADEEVGWLGTVEQTRYGNFLINEVFLLKQEVSAASTEISEEGIAELAQELLDTRVDGVEVANAIRFWGHSHVRMQTYASPQDETQMNLFRENGCPWFVRGILNKLGRMEFTIFLFDSGIRIDDAPWAIYEGIDESMREGIEEEFVEKVTRYRPPTYIHPHQNHGPRTGRDGVIAAFDGDVGLDEEGEESYER